MNEDQLKKIREAQLLKELELDEITTEQLLNQDVLNQLLHILTGKITDHPDEFN